MATILVKGFSFAGQECSVSKMIQTTLDLGWRLKPCSVVYRAKTLTLESLAFTVKED